MSFILRVFIWSVFLLVCGCSKNLEECIPKIERDTPQDVSTRYYKEFPGRWKRQIDFPRDLNGGRPDLLKGDYDSKSGMYVGVAEFGKVYLYDPIMKSWQQERALETYRILDAAIIRSNGVPVILVTGQEAGQIQYENMKLYAYNLNLQKLEFIMFGLDCEISPDKTKVAFDRYDGDGFNQINLWDIDMGEVKTLFSYSETDRGEGSSVFYRWSEDSKAIFFSGRISSFQKSFYNDPEKIDLLYLVTNGRFFQYSGPPAKYK